MHNLIIYVGLSCVTLPFSLCIMSVQYCGRYHEYCGGYLEYHGDVMMHEGEYNDARGGIL